MNIIWTTLIVVSILCLCFGDAASFLPAVLSGATTAVETATSLCAVYCVWLGLFKVMENVGLVEKLSKLTQPLIRLLYGKIDDVAASYIALNMSANLLGVSNAATPSAVKAIGILEKDNTTLSRAGTLLFVINATSIQILPSTVLGMLAGNNSSNPSGIILPTLISTAATTVLGVLLVTLLTRKRSSAASPQLIKGGIAK